MPEGVQSPPLNLRLGLNICVCDITDITAIERVLLKI